MSIHGFCWEPAAPWPTDPVPPEASETAEVKLPGWPVMER